MNMFIHIGLEFFSQNDLVTPIYDNGRENDFNYKYNSAMGCYYENKSLNLKKVHIIL